MLINKIAQYSVLLSTLVVLSSCDLLQVPDEKGTPEDPQNLAPKLTVIGTSGKELSAGDTVLFDLKLEDDANQMSLSWNFESSVYDYVDLDLVSDHSIMSLNNNDQLTFEFNSQQYFADKTYEVVFTVTDAKGLTHSQKMDFNVTALPLSQAISNIVIDDVKTINENSVLNINSTFDVHELINPQAVKINWTSSDEQLISSVLNSNNIEGLIPEISQNRNVDLTYEILVLNQSVYSQIVPITIVNQNIAPTVQLQENTIVRGLEPVELIAQATDIDGLISTYLWTQTSGSPVPLDNINSDTLQFIAPDLNVEQNFEFTVTVEDNDGDTATANTSITVTPKNQLPIIEAIADQSVKANTQLTVSAIASDADGEIVSYQWTQLSGATLAVSGSETSELSITTLPVDATQNYSFELIVVDNEGAMASTVFNLSVMESQAPEINLVSQTNVRGLQNVQLDALATDSDGTIENYLWTQISGDALAIDNVTTLSLQFVAPDVSVEKIYEFTLTVKDNDGEVSTANTKIIVTPKNKLPVIEMIADQIVRENTQVNILAIADDADGEITSYQWTQLSGTTLTVTGSETSELSISTQSVDTTQNYSFELVVEDNVGATASTIFNLSVIDLSAPIITNQSVTSINEQTLFTADVLIEDDGSIQTILWEQISGPSVTLNNVDQSAVSFTAPVALANQTAAVVKLQVSATDNDGVTSSLVVNVVINPVNALPTFENLSDLEITDDQIYVLNLSTLDSDGSVTDVQITQDAVQNIGITKVSNTRFEFTFDELAPQQEQMLYVFTITATDNEGAVASQEIEINVLAQNSTPKFNLESNTFDMSEFSNFSILLNIEDDHPTYLSHLSAELISGPAVSGPDITGITYAFGYSVDSKLEIVYSASYHLETTQYIFELTVEDSHGLSSTETVYINVLAQNKEPIIMPIDYMEINDDQVYSLIVNVVDYDGSISSVDVTQSAAQSILITKVSNTEFELTFDELDIAVTEVLNSFTITATDNEGAVATSTFEINVIAQNDSPFIAKDETLKVSEALPFSFDPVITDDSESVVYLWEQVILENAIEIVLANPQSNTLMFDAPAVFDNQTVTFNLTITDIEGLSTSQLFNIQIQDVQTPAQITMPSQADVTSNELVVFDVLVEDDEGALQISWQQIIVDSESQINFTADATRFELTAPEIDVSTTYTFELMVTDYDGLVTSERVEITVAPIIVLIPPTIDLVEQVLVAPNDILNLPYSMQDDKGDPLFNWEQINLGDSDPVEFIGYRTQFSMYVPDIDTQETYTFELTVTDSDNLSVIKTLDVIVNPVPVVQLPYTAITIDEKIEFELTATSISDDQDVTSMLWTQLGSHDPLTLTGADTDTLSFTAPNISQSITYEFVLEATDNLGFMGAQFVEITIDPILIAPIIGLPSTPINMDEYSTITINADASDEEQVVDVFWNVEGMYDYIAVSGERTDQLTIEAFEHHENTTYEFELLVADNDGQVTQRTVVVNVNQAFVEPVIDMDVTAFTSSEVEMIQITGQASDNQGYVDYSWQQIGNNGTLMLENTDQQMVNVYSPDISVETTFTLLLTVTDVDGLTDTQEISVTFVPHYIVPSIDLNVPEFALTNLAVDFTANASDQDGEIVSILWTQTSGTPGQFTNETSDTATFVVSDVVEDLMFDVTVTDNDNQTITQSFTVTTEELIDENAPQVSIGEDRVLNEGLQLYLQASTSNTNGINFSYVWEQISDFDYDFDNSIYNPQAYQLTAMEVINDKVIQLKVSIINDENGQVLDTDIINITVINTDEYSDPFDISAVIDSALSNCIAQNNYEYSEQVEVIDCPNLMIGSLVGVESFVNVSEINVSGNIISDLSNLSALSNLSVLNVSQNNLEDALNLTELVNLTQLDVSNNQVSDLQLPVDSKVRSLNIEYTHIQNLSFEFIKALSELSFKGTVLDCNYVHEQININGDYLGFNTVEDCISALPVNLYFAQYTNVAPTIDGTILDDADLWDVAYWQPIDVLWNEGTDKETYPTSEDISAQYKTLWDENYLYVLVEIVDDVAITQNAYWANDNVEIFLDENNTGGGHEEHYNSSNAFAFHINRLGESYDLHSRSVFQNKDNQVYTQITDQGDNRFIWEIRIALMDETFDPSKANVARTIKENEVIGFTMSVIDADEQGQRQNFLGSVNTPEHISNQGYQNADGFGALILNSISVP